MERWNIVEINVGAGKNVYGTYTFDFGYSAVGAFKWPLAPRAAPTWSSLRWRGGSGYSAGSWISHPQFPTRENYKLRSNLVWTQWKQYLARRQLRWLGGHVSRMPFDRFPRRLLSSPVYIPKEAHIYTYCQIYVTGGGIIIRATKGGKKSAKKGGKKKRRGGVSVCNCKLNAYCAYIYLIYVCAGYNYDKYSVGRLPGRNYTHSFKRRKRKRFSPGEWHPDPALSFVKLPEREVGWHIWL